MPRATCEMVPDNEADDGEIPGAQGGYANAAPLEAGRDELQSVLEGWIALGLALGHPFPALDGRHAGLERDAA